MKKLMILAVTAVMLMLLSVSTSAGFSVTAVTTLSAESDDSELSMTYISGQYTVENYKFGLILGTGELDEEPADLGYTEIGASYKIGGDERTQYYIGCVYMANTMEADVMEMKISGICLEVSGSTLMGRNMLLSGNLGYSISGSASFSTPLGGADTNDVSIFYLKANFLFLFSKSFGIAAGYTMKDTDVEGSKSDFNQITLGATYIF